MDAKAIMEEIQKINLQLFAIHKHCSSLDSSYELSRLKTMRSELYEQLAKIRHKINMQRLQK